MRWTNIITAIFLICLGVWFIGLVAYCYALEIKREMEEAEHEANSNKS